MRTLRVSAAAIGVMAALCRPAAAIDILDRIVAFTEDRVRQASVGKTDGPAPLRIGLMLPADGEFREPAERLTRGWKIAIALSDGIVANRPVQIVPGDTANSPVVAVQAAIDMMRAGPVDVFAGVIGADVARAMAIFADKADRPVVLAGAIGEGVMSGACSSRVVRTSFNIGPYQTTAGKFLAGKYRTAVTLAPDADGGPMLVRRFADAYRAAGGKVVEQAWAPPGRNYDWSGWIARLSASGPTMIYAIFDERNAERLVYAHSRAGLKGRVALLGPEWMFGPRTLDRRGAHAAGLRFLTAYLPTSPSPANSGFVAAYRATFNESPDLYAYLGYENALSVLLTAAELEGKTDDAEKFIATLKALDYTGLMPRGAFTFNATGSAGLSRLYWVEAQRVDGETVLEELASVPVAPDRSTCSVRQAGTTRQPS